MKTIKLPYLLFSLAVIAALVMAAIPAAPAYALTDDSASSGTSLNATVDSTGANAIVCKRVVKWRDGHRVVVSVCRRVNHRPSGDA